MVTFEGYERRIAQIEKCMKEYGFSSLEEVKQYTVCLLYTSLLAVSVIGAICASAILMERKPARRDRRPGGYHEK